MPVNDGSNIRITPFTPMQVPDMAKEASSLFSAMRRASGGGGGGGLGGQIMFNPVTNQFERIPGGSFKERQLNMDAMNNMRVQAAWNNSENKNVQAIQKKLQDFENASVERKNQIIDDIRRNDIPKLANDSGIDGRAFIAGPLQDLEKRQQEAAQQVAKTGAMDVLWDSARIGLRNFTDSLADLGSNAQEQAARANARQQYIEQVRSENAYLQNSARRQAEGADFMDRFSGREVLAAAGEFAGQNIPTFGAMALGGAIGAGLAGAVGAGANAVRLASLAGQALPGAVTGAGQQMTASVDAIMSDTTKTTEQKMQELEDAQTSSRLFGGALGAVVMPVGQGIRRAVSEGLANRGIGGSQVAQTIRNQRAGKALPNEVTSWDEALANARRADIEAENTLIRGRSLARFRQQAADSALEGALFGTAGQLGTNVIANDPIGTNMGAATLGGLVGGLGFTPFNRRTLRDVPAAVYNPAVPVNPVRAYQYGPRVNTSINTSGPVRLNDMLQNATWEQRQNQFLRPPVERPVGYNTRPGEFGFAPSAAEGLRAGERARMQGFNDIDFMLQRTMPDPDEVSPRFNEELYQQDRAAAANAMAEARPVPYLSSNWSTSASAQRPAATRQQQAQQAQQAAPQAVQQQAAAPSAADVSRLDSLAAGEHAKLLFSTTAVGDAYQSIANHIRRINSLGKEARDNGYINNKLAQKTNSIIDKLSPDELRNLADHMNVFLQYEAHRSKSNRILQPTALLYKAKDAHTRQVLDYIQSRLDALAQPESSQAQQQLIQKNASPTPPKVDDNQVPASISADRIPENENGEQGLNLMGPNAFVPKQASAQQPAVSTQQVRQQPVGDVPRPKAVPADKTVTNVINNILKKWGKGRGKMSTAHKNSIDKAVDALTPEQKQILVRTIDQRNGPRNMSSSAHTQNAIRYAYDRAKSSAVQEGATNAQQPAAQPRSVQGAGAEPAATTQQKQQQAASAAAAINTVTGSSGKQTTAGLEQPVNTGAPAADRRNIDSDSGGKTVDEGSPAADADGVSQGTPRVSQTTEKRGNAGAETQQPGEAPKAEGVAEPETPAEQPADGKRGPKPAATVDAKTGEGAGSPRVKGSPEQSNGGDAANAGGDKQSGNESGDGNGAVEQQVETPTTPEQTETPVTPEQADRQQVAASSFNVKVSPDGGITSSRDGWHFDDGAITTRARKNVEYDPATGISYNVKRVANNDRNFTPGRTLYPTGVRQRQAPAISVHISNADGATFSIVFSNADAKKYSPNWIPNIEGTGITVDKDMFLHIDPNTTNPELRRAMSGDGALVNVAVTNAAGQPITSNGQVGSRTFPLLPNEWAIKPTVQETLQAKANRDTAAAAAKDAKDTATSQTLVAPKAEGQDPADAKVLEDLANITKTDAQTPAKTPEQEAKKDPPRRTPRKKATEGSSDTKKRQKKAEEEKPAEEQTDIKTQQKKAEEKPAEEQPTTPREEAAAQAEAVVESKIDPRTQSYDYGQEDGTAIISSRLRELQEEQIDAMADRIYELQEQGVAAVNQHPVTTDEAPTMVMSFINDMPPKQLERVIQAAGVRNLSTYKRGGRATVDPMMVAEDMTYALIANDIARKAADAGITLKLSPTDQAYISLANKQELPPVQLSAEEKGLLDIWLGDATIPLKERQDIETAFDVVMTTPDKARKRILQKAQSAACVTARKRGKTRAENDEKTQASRETAEAAERAAEQRDIAKHNAEARQISHETRTAITNS